MVDQVCQAGHRDDLHARDQGGLAPVSGGHENALVAFGSRQGGHRQHAAHMAHRAIQRELAHDERAFQRFRQNLPGGGQHTQRNRQVVGRALFAQRGRRQVHRQPLHGKEEAGIADGRLHPLAALLHGGIGQADHHE